MSKVPVGQIRPSQLLWSSGPGAMIDLPNLSVITMGLDSWDTSKCAEVVETRLLHAVQRLHGIQVKKLLVPPVIEDDRANPFSEEGKIGVPVKPFPRFLRCVKCQMLSAFDLGQFSLEINQYIPERTKFVHSNCEKGKGGKSDAVPARFMVACKNGHLDDFPWHWFVHGGHSDCRGILEFYETGASLQTENLWVECKSCGVKKSLAQAFGERGYKNLPSCRGRHPHLDHFDDACNEQLRAVLLGASNSWFPVTLSVLAIPMMNSPLSQLILDGWHYFEDADSLDAIKFILKTLAKTDSLTEIEEFEPEDVWIVVKELTQNGFPESVDTKDLKLPEWEVLTSPTRPSDWPHFYCSSTPNPATFDKYIEEVVLLERLREVNALIGFTRVEAPYEFSDMRENPKIAPISKEKPKWIPVNEVHGEGIFIRFKEQIVDEWEKHIPVKERRELLLAGHRAWRTARNMPAAEGFPGIRYTMLHTLAHLLIRELALECGYNAASIRERIYASSEENRMAGILIYTASADSDGTLGGLVDLGKAENLDRLMRQALGRATICASDPLCAEHDPSLDSALHLASCHACAFVSETSCEAGNRYLDRALLVKTIESSDAAFFS